MTPKHIPSESKRVRELEKELSRCRHIYEKTIESEKIASLIVHQTSIPTLVIDRNHTITHCNRAYEALTGLPANSMIGTKDQWRTFYDEPRLVLVDYIVDQVPHDQILKEFGERCRKSDASEDVFEAELFFPDLDDNGRWLFFTGAPLRDPEGIIVGAVETVQNVTKRKQAELALRRSGRLFKTLLDFIPYPIAVYTMQGIATFVNRRFTQVFGWSIDELNGKQIRFIPQEVKKATIQSLKLLYKEKVLVHQESKRFAKDGRLLDVSVQAAVYSEPEQRQSGIIVIFHDVTEKNRTVRINKALLDISLALPKHPDLKDLLNYINEQIKIVMGTEGSVVLLLDEENREFHSVAASYDAPDTQRTVEEIRFSIDELVAGVVVRTGRPILVNDTADDPRFHTERDDKLGYRTRNLAIVPLKGRVLIGGVLCAVNKKQGDFGQADLEVLEMIAGIVAVCIGNAKIADELNKAYSDLAGINSAKDAMISHLSHELRTPLAILSGSLAVLGRALSSLQEISWQATYKRIMNSLERIKDIQFEVEDIAADRRHRPHFVLSLLLEQCTDELATLVAEQCGDGPIVERLREHIDEIFGPKVSLPVEVRLDEEIRKRLEELRPLFGHRDVSILTRFESTPIVLIPLDVLHKVIDGLVKNAVENTPDEGEIEIAVMEKGDGALFFVKDCGVGIPTEAQERIFEGFFSTRDTMAYSSKRPFDFNAGGRGADLLRMKIFSERYHFRIDMASERCNHLPTSADICPGRITQCSFCSGSGDCHRSGGTIFSLYFPPAS